MAWESQEVDIQARTGASEVDGLLNGDEEKR